MTAPPAGLFNVTVKVSSNSVAASLLIVMVITLALFGSTLQFVNG